MLSPRMSLFDDDADVFPDVSGFIDEEETASINEKSESIDTNGLYMDNIFSRLFTNVATHSDDVDTNEDDIDRARSFNGLIDWVVRSGGFSHPGELPLPLNLSIDIKTEP